MNGANSSSKDKFIVKGVLLFSLATIAFYLLTEHRAHLLTYSSDIIFFVFILMHIFMHSGHGGHGHGKHKHKEAEKGIDESAKGHEDTGQHEHRE